MRTAEIAQRYLDYFEKNDHLIVPSASLVSDDPSLLFTVAGMVPMIPYLTGVVPAPHPRIADMQKCIRTNDIEEVGRTARHGTFFQMLGNWSFGDYFKEGAIRYAWELLTSSEADGGLGFDEKDLWVTVYETDDEAESIWRDIIGLKPERIQRLGRADNYWNTGQPGPGGPDSEIFFDRGPAYGRDGGPAVDDTRFLEIWNLVFMQDFIDNIRGKTEFDITGELPMKNIDTGMGLERVAFLKQGVENMYETDQVRPVLDRAVELSGRRYGAVHEDDVRFRVIADHVRSSLMLLSDGIRPSNEGRGYILRRLMRRTVRAMRLLGVDAPSFPELFEASRDAMKASYPELEKDWTVLSSAAFAEEETFRRTLAQGSTILDLALSDTKKSGAATLSGSEAFLLHDTYGFPIDLTLEMAAEHGLKVDRDGFVRLMDEQRQRAKADARAKKGGHANTEVWKDLRSLGATDWRAYEELTTTGSIVGLVRDGARVEELEPGQTGEVVLDRTSFYAESGGQVADGGVIVVDGARLVVRDVQRPVKGLVVHSVEVADGPVRVGDEASAEVDPQWRIDACQAHSGTHVVHAALRQVLGPSALQSGSYNKPGYLRLDFAWNQGLSADTRAEIEHVANLAVRDDLPVAADWMTLPEARDRGALALFGETYGEQVRVVEIGGEWSRELCGGTHVRHSSQIGALTLTGESSVGSGVRRLEAFVGMNALAHLATERALVAELSSIIKAPAADLPERVGELVARLREVEKELDKVRREQVAASAGSLTDAAREVAGVTFVGRHIAGGAPDDLRQMVTDTRARLGEERPSVVALTGDGPGKPVIVVATNEAARAKGVKAGALVRVAAQVLGGGGGGKDDLAQGGGQDAAKVEDALSAVERELGA
jgi:alanyl-tRNA synthetase